DPVGAVDRLRLHRRVPPGVEEEHVLRGGEVETEAAGPEAHEKQEAVRIALKALDARPAISRPPVQVLVARAGAVELRPHDVEQTRELREHQRLVSLLADLSQPGQERVELGGGFIPASPVQKPGVASRLTEPQERFEDLDLRPPDAVPSDA